MLLSMFLISIEELVIPIGMPRKEVKAAIEIYPVIVEAKIRKSVQYNLELYTSFCVFYLSIHFALFL